MTVHQNDSDFFIKLFCLLGFTTTVKAFLLIRNGIEEAQEKRSSSFHWGQVK